MAARKTKKTSNSDCAELIAALDDLEREKQISKDVILEAIENSLLAACKNQYGKSENIRVSMNRETGEIHVFSDRTVVEDDLVEDPVSEIGITEATLKYGEKNLGDIVSREVTPKDFGRIAAQKAKQVVVQKIREEERKVLYKMYLEKQREVITGIVQRYNGNNICVNLGKVDAILMESEQVRTEHFKPTEHIKLYIVEVKDTTKGPRITISRTHPEFVKRLFEEEVTEIQDGTVEIKAIAREAGSRTKIAVYSSNPNVDPVGACVGVNGVRVNAVVDELRGEKIDIITWSDDPAVLIENALSPASVVSVSVDEEDKTARVIVPGDQLSLAIGKEGQNVRIAARLTGWKIDIKSHSKYEACLEAGESLFPKTPKAQEVSSDPDEEDLGIVEVIPPGATEREPEEGDETQGMDWEESPEDFEEDRREDGISEEEMSDGNLSDESMPQDASEEQE